MQNSLSGSLHLKKKLSFQWSSGPLDELRLVNKTLCSLSFYEEGFGDIRLGKRKGPAKTPFYLNRHENLLSQNVPYTYNLVVVSRFTVVVKKRILFLQVNFNLIEPLCLMGFRGIIGYIDLFYRDAFIMLKA
jgi:hypothetical protein